MEALWQYYVLVYGIITAMQLFYKNVFSTKSVTNITIPIAFGMSCRTWSLSCGLYKKLCEITTKLKLNTFRTNIHT